MSRDEDDLMFNLGQGCMLHGDEFMRECTMCGIEFCSKCHPRAVVCPDCTAGGDEDEDGDLEAAFGADEDEEVDDLLTDAAASPEEDLPGDEDEEKDERA